MTRVLQRIACVAVLILAWVGAAVAQTSYLIQPGDTLQINVLEDSSLDRSVLVLPDGSISLPLAGAVRAAGLTTDQLQARLADRLASNFASRPSVFVGVGPLRDEEEEEEEFIDVFVVGEVAAPGQLELEPGATILQAIAAAGGPSRFAATRRIQLRRTDARTGQEYLGNFDYQTVLNGGAAAPIWRLADGDVIVVPERRLFE